MINSGVDFTLRATFCKTSPGLTMYSSFSGDGVRERRMSTFTSPNKSLASSACREGAVPEPADGALCVIAPSVMAILAVKFLGNDFQRAEKSDQRRSHELTRHLRILDVRRSALRAANNGGGDIGVACLPFDH